MVAPLSYTSVYFSELDSAIDVFNGVYVFHNALNLQQAATCAERYSHYRISSIVLQHVLRAKVRHPLSSRLRALNGRFPAMTSLVLHLCLLLENTRHAPYAERAVAACLGKMRRYPRWANLPCAGAAPAKVLPQVPTLLRPARNRRRTSILRPVHLAPILHREVPGRMRAAPPTSGCPTPTWESGCLRKKNHDFGARVRTEYAHLLGTVSRRQGQSKGIYNRK
jgi:hypothetical protein